jgi:Zn-dependent peptidase ImmA (M78 family)/DNA-binding Xre family transcriptional regulator
MMFGRAFPEILKKRRMSQKTLAERAGLDESHLEKLVVGKAEVTKDAAETIALALGVPLRALFASSAASLSSIPDFRRADPKPGLMDQGSIKAIGYVERISLSLAGAGIDFALSEDLGAYNGPFSKEAARSLARKWRDRWAIKDIEQLEWRDANRVYVSLRNFIEGFGVFVMHFSFGSDDVSGLYAKVDGGPHTILINTTGSSKARKLFTLAHEFCHFLLRADGFSNTALANNTVERFCNHFAAYLLAPDTLISRALSRYGYVPSLVGDSVRLLARNIGISQQACVLRLMEMELLAPDSYGKWMARFDGKAPPGDRTDGTGGGGNDPIQTKRTHYGSSLISKLALARREGILDPIEIYRIAGIKPKYQVALLGGQ